MSRTFTQSAFRGLDLLLEALSATMMVGAACVAVLQVFFRYVLNASLPWPEEVAQLLFTWSVFLGLAVCIGRDRHIAITLFSGAFGPTAKHIHRVFLYTITACCCVILIVHGWTYTQQVMGVYPALALPLKWLFMAAPVAGVLGLIMLLRSRNEEPLWLAPLAILLGCGLYLLLRNAGGSVLDNYPVTAVLIVSSLLMIFLEVPVGFAFIVGSYAALSTQPSAILITLPQNMAASLNSFTLLAIPFFIMAAAVMNAGGVTRRIVSLAMHLVGHLRGGLGQANIVTNLLMAGVSGSSTADASATTKLLVPEMARNGYDRGFSCALTAAGSTLANMIPPSLGLIIYAALASVSVGALFVATLVPGILAALSLAFVVWLIARSKGYGAGQARSSGATRLKALGYAFPALLLPLVVVGGVRVGAFTATEAGAIALVMALLIGALMYRELTGANLIAALRSAVEDTVVVAVVIAAAAPFAWILTFEQAPQKTAAWLGSLTENPVVLLLLINLLLLFVGLFIEMIAALVVLTPILVPVVMAAQIDPIQFGVVMIMNLVIGALTPPLGVLTFTAARVGGVPATAVFKAIIPFIIALITVLMLTTYIPGLTLIPLGFLGP